MEVEEVINISDIPSLLALIPKLVGFTPQDSLVVLVLQDSQVILTARADLADVTPEGALETMLAKIWMRYENAVGYFIVYGASSALATELLRRCAALGTDSFRYGCHVVDESWFGCDGNCGEFSGESVSEAQEVQLVFPQLTSREALVEMLIPEDMSPVREQLLEVQCSQLEAIPRQSLPALLRQLMAKSEPAEGDYLQLGLLAQDAHVRNTAILALTNASASEQVRRWLQVVKLMTPRLQLQVVSLLSFISWVGGSGALQVACLERAAAILGYEAPDFIKACRAADSKIPTLLQVSAMLNLEVVPPVLWPKLKAKILEADLADLPRRKSNIGGKMTL